MKEFNVKIEVKLKPAFLYPQRKTVLQALNNLGYKEVHDARNGKLIELSLSDWSVERVRERVNDMCMKLLSNPLIENFEVNIEE